MEVWVSEHDADRQTSFFCSKQPELRTTPQLDTL